MTTLLHRISLLLLSCLVLNLDKADAQVIIDALDVGIGPSPNQILQQGIFLDLDFNAKFIGLAVFQGRPDIPFPVYPVADVIDAKFEYVIVRKCE